MARTESTKPIKRSGTIWAKAPRIRSRIVASVCAALRSTYGAPRLGNPVRSVDDLVFVTISNKTAPRMARKTYRRLKDTYETWEDMLASPLASLRSILKPAGLSTVKSRQLRAALGKIKRDFGRCDLRALKGKKEEEIHSYLAALPGVSDKVAKCVMMYTMAASVLPVDTHVHRVTTRLGWTARKRADQCHEELESLVPGKWRYVFHVGCVLHGREVCRPQSPLCERCCINRYCEYFRKRDAKG